MNNKNSFKMNNENKLIIIIFLWLILILGSFYLWKVYAPNNIWNNTSVENKSENFINIWDYSINEFKQKINKDYTLIDLRTPWEIKDWYIGWVDLKIDYYDNNFKSEINKLDKTKKYLIYCRSWSRSWNALYLMKSLWFRDVHDLSWWINTWERAWEKITK